MRMHTALHLLSAVLPYPVTGGSVGEAESRLDFDIPEAGLDKDAITAKLTEMIATDAAVTQPLDHRRRARRQSGPGQDHVGEAADGHRPGAADRDRRPRPAALRRHACAQHRARSARCASRRSRRRANRTAACVWRWCSLHHESETSMPDATARPPATNLVTTDWLAARPGRARGRRRRRLVLSAGAQARRQGGVSRRPYPGRGVLRHRRHRRPFHRPAAHAAGRRRSSREDGRRARHRRRRHHRGL